jgi:type I restriction enzyme S subunit
MPTPIGRAWLATAMPWRMITAVDVAIIRVQSDVLNPLFLEQAWNESLNLQRIAAQASGTTRLRITRRELAALEFVVPPNEIQSSFGKFIRPHMEMIQTLRQQIRNLRRTRDLLLPKLISGELDVSTISTEQLTLTA